MPTVFLLDVSLSMCRTAIMPDGTEPYQLRNLAIHGLNSLLDYMNQNCKLEFTTLVVFSSQWEVIVPFTRDFESIKTALMKLDVYDKTCLITALKGVKSVVLDEWGGAMPCQVLLITDGNSGLGLQTLKQQLQSFQAAKDADGDDQNFPLPFPFPCKLHILCLSNPHDPTLQAALPFYQKLIDINGNGGQVFIPEGSPTLKSVQQMFMKLAETYYKPFHGILRCGNLMSHVSLHPPPEVYNRPHDFEWVKAEISSDILICGFLDINDVASPPALTRHLVLPIPSKDENKLSAPKMEPTEISDDDTGGNEDGKQPSFCVLLHGSLKVESMVAICHLGNDWYGMLYSWADSKKKSNLMLSTFEPGTDVIPWLGNFMHLGPVELALDRKDSDDEEPAPHFPVKPQEKRSYSQNCVVWLRQSCLQADIQKILRHARKLPEKTQHFYKELNRLRRAALSFGFYELLEGMATILERECTLLPGTAHPDAALQLTHAATALRSPQCRDYNTSIMPLHTKFTTDD